MGAESPPAIVSNQPGHLMLTRVLGVGTPGGLAKTLPNFPRVIGF